MVWEWPSFNGASLLHWTVQQDQKIRSLAPSSPPANLPHFAGWIWWTTTIPLSTSNFTKKVPPSKHGVLIVRDWSEWPAFNLAIWLMHSNFARRWRVIFSNEIFSLFFLFFAKSSKTNKVVYNKKRACRIVNRTEMSSAATLSFGPGTSTTRTLHECGPYIDLPPP